MRYNNACLYKQAALYISIALKYKKTCDHLSSFPGLEKLIIWWRNRLKTQKINYLFKEI